MANLTVNYMKPMAATSNGVWQHNSPIDFSFPLLAIQMTLVLVVTRTLAYFFKPLRQPRVIAEIIGGILLGPTALGRNHDYMAKLFPKQSMTVLDTFANIGLLFFMFMVGLELDLRTLKNVGSQALAIAGAGMCVPFALGAGVSVLIHKTISSGVGFAPFLVFMGVAMSITAFPVLARILAERKMLTTDVGQMAMSAAAVNDVSAWILLALAIALSGPGSGVVAIWVLLSGLAFVIYMFLVIKPFVTWMAHQSPANEPIKEIYLCITLALVLVSGFITDAIGIHLIFGGFVLGLIIPKDASFAQFLFEKIEDFVSILLLPLYFASSGLKTNVAAIQGGQSWGLLVLVICVACIGKIGGTVLVSQYYTKNLRNSLTLGVLMNAKGLVELIVLNIGKDRGVLTDEVFAIMVLMALFTTFITTPILMTIYKPARNQVPYIRRKLYKEQSAKEQLRILSCVHGARDIGAMMNLTETMRGQSTREVRLYLLHLMELSERSSTIVTARRGRNDESGGRRIDGIVEPFEAFGQLSKVVVRSMTAVSQFEDMHEDIRTAAEIKRATIIFLHFHKKVGLVDGSFEDGHSGVQTVNQKVLQYAPCSVGIFIDRGFFGARQIAPGKIDYNVVVLFFGGPDDREALSFGARMTEHPGVKLKVLRYTSARDEAAESSDSALGRLQDEELLNAVQSGNQNFAKVITFEDVQIAGDLGESIQEAVGKDIENDLILVGRSSSPPPLACLSQNGQDLARSELGYVGHILASSSSRVSILVVQQYNPAEVDSSEDMIRHNLSNRLDPLSSSDHSTV